MSAMTNKLLARLRREIENADLGVSEAMFRRDALFATNRALRLIGAPQVTDINSRPQLIRAITFIQSSAE